MQCEPTTEKTARLQTLSDVDRRMERCRGVVGGCEGYKSDTNTELWLECEREGLLLSRVEHREKYAMKK